MNQVSTRFESESSEAILVSMVASTSKLKVPAPNSLASNTSSGFYASKHQPQIEKSQRRLQADDLWVWMLTSHHSRSFSLTSDLRMLTCLLRASRKLDTWSVPAFLSHQRPTASRNLTQRRSLRFLESTSVKAKPARCGPDPCMQPLTPGERKAGRGGHGRRSHGLGGRGHGGRSHGLQTCGGENY